MAWTFMSHRRRIKHKETFLVWLQFHLWQKRQPTPLAKRTHQSWPLPHKPRWHSRDSAQHQTTRRNMPLRCKHKHEWKPQSRGTHADQALSTILKSIQPMPAHSSRSWSHIQDNLPPNNYVSFPCNFSLQNDLGKSPVPPHHTSHTQ